MAIRLGLVAFGFSVAINLLLLVSPIYMLQIYDRVLASGSDETLLFLTVAAVGLLGALGALEHYRAQILIRLGTFFSKTFDQTLFAGVLSSLNKAHQGQPTQPMRDLDTVTGFLGSPAPTSLMDVPWVPFFLLIIFLMHPMLGIVAAVGAGLLGVLAVMTERFSRAPMKAAHGYRAHSMQFVDSTQRNAPAIEAMGMGHRLLGQWIDPYRRATDAQAVAAERNGFIKGWVKFLRPTLQAAMLGTGAYLALRGEISAGSIVAASIISGRALAPVEQAVGSWRQVIAARDAFGRLKVFMETYCHVPKDTVSLPRPTGQIVAEKVLGSPPGVKDIVIKNVSFAVKPGEFLGIAGPSGSGKSTLAHLLIGVWQPMSGSVRLDGADVSKWNKTELGAHVGFLPQECDLFQGTVGQNIARFGDVQSDAVLEAAQMAGVHELILRFEEGYETRVGPGGAWLSAGQRQRIHLARAIYGRPAILVLDEPNTHMDAAGEAALMKSLKAVRAHGTTVIMVCHRRPLLALCDRILVMREGQVQTLGAASEVLNQMSQGGAKRAANDRRAAAAAGR